MPSIPASYVASVIPSVLSAGGTALDLNGLVLTNSTRVPLGNPRGFSNAIDVGAFFGAASNEYSFASRYFLGWDNSTKKPGMLIFAQYPVASVAGYLRGGSLASLTLAQLQALTGSLVVVIDGTTASAGSLNFSTANSFSAAAALIQTGLGLTGPTVSVVTGSIAAPGTMTVTAVTSGSLVVGTVLGGSGVAPGTIITAILTGTGGVGTYSVTPSQTVSSTAITGTTPMVTYDSLTNAFQINSTTTGVSSSVAPATGTLSGPLALTLAGGAIVSAGAVAANPGPAMTAVVANTQNWAAFTTMWEPNSADCIAFATWNTLQNNRFGYVMWDTDPNAKVAGNTTSIGAILKAGSYSGVMPWYTPVLQRDAAAFALSYAACLDFERLNGRTTLAFRSQSGLIPDVTSASDAAGLTSNGYDFYGSFATANDEFEFAYPGSITGKFLWADSYFNQIQLTNQLQLALISGLTSVGSVPYNADGRTMIKAFCNDPIQQALNFGSIRAGVVLSTAQAAIVNGQAGLRIDDTLTQRGWYLQVLDATAQVRAARASPPCTLWYMDGQSVQSIVLASIEIQ
jgi:hypothetical protein